MRNRTEEEINARKQNSNQLSNAKNITNNEDGNNNISKKKQKKANTKKSQKKKKRGISILTVFFILVAVISASYLIYHQWQSHLATAQFDDLAKMEKEDVKKKYKQMVAWIDIKGTRIDYPVMECPKNDSQYWLRRNVKGDYSINGTVFMDPNGDIENSYNLLVYGHNMTDGSMFGTLEKFESGKYRKKHNKIHVVKWYHDGTHTEGDYKIFAYYKNSIYDNENHLDYADIQTEEEFNNYIKYCKRVSTFKSKIKPKYGDELVTLSTCSYHVLGRDGRQVLVGIKQN